MNTVERLFRCASFVLLLALSCRCYADDKPYRIVNGVVDQSTLRGWQVYQDAHCALCHGDSAQAAAPLDLAERLRTMSGQEFSDSVLKGKGLMPPFIANRQVADNIDSLYAYLKARSDGAVGPGKPKTSSH